MSDCLFCKIASGEIKGDVVYQDEDVVAFNDIGPQAPTHILVIPRKHIATLNDLETEDSVLLGKLFQAAKNIMGDRGYDSYRCVMNCNEEAGQTVFHIHLHVLAGRGMHWPPG